jgi:hypothetical protein
LNNLSTTGRAQVHEVLASVFRRLRLPVRDDVKALERRLSSLSRRINRLEKTPKRNGAVAA